MAGPEDILAAIETKCIRNAARRSKFLEFIESFRWSSFSAMGTLASPKRAMPRHPLHLDGRSRNQDVFFLQGILAVPGLRALVSPASGLLLDGDGDPAVITWGCLRDAQRIRRQSTQAPQWADALKLQLFPPSRYSQAARFWSPRTKYCGASNARYDPRMGWAVEDDRLDASKVTSLPKVGRMQG